jgi:hypothetical protein
MAVLVVLSRPITGHRDSSNAVPDRAEMTASVDVIASFGANPSGRRCPPLSEHAAEPAIIECPDMASGDVVMRESADGV